MPMFWSGALLSITAMLPGEFSARVVHIPKGEAGDPCSGDQCGLLATNPDGSLKTGTVTIHNGLRLLLDGHAQQQLDRYHLRRGGNRQLKRRLYRRPQPGPSFAQRWSGHWRSILHH